MSVAREPLNCFDDFFDRLETQVSTAEHQDRCDRPGRERAEQQRARQQEQEFVTQ
jgi:hypothetical protein